MVPGSHPQMHDPDGKRSEQRPGRERPVAGLTSLRETARHTLRVPGALRRVRTLLQLNQVRGFDCPGCAWPDPDHDENRQGYRALRQPRHQVLQLIQVRHGMLLPNLHVRETAARNAVLASFNSAYVGVWRD